MGSEAWAGARRLSELLRGEYQAMETNDDDGASSPAEPDSSQSRADEPATRA